MKSKVAAVVSIHDTVPSIFLQNQEIISVQQTVQKSSASAASRFDVRIYIYTEKCRIHHTTLIDNLRFHYCQCVQMSGKQFVLVPHFLVNAAKFGIVMQPELNTAHTPEYMSVHIRKKVTKKIGPRDLKVIYPKRRYVHPYYCPPYTCICLRFYGWKSHNMYHMT